MHHVCIIRRMVSIQRGDAKRVRAVSTYFFHAFFLYYTGGIFILLANIVSKLFMRINFCVDGNDLCTNRVGMILCVYVYVLFLLLHRSKGISHLAKIFYLFIYSYFF